MSKHVYSDPETKTETTRSDFRWASRKRMTDQLERFTPDPETLRDWREGVEWDRKGIHLSSTILALWTYYLHEPIATGGLLVATLFVLAVDWSRLRSRRWGVWMYRKLPFVFRVDERHVLSGASVMMIGSALTSALFPAGPATAGILCLAWGDSAAAIVGQAYSRWRLSKQVDRAGGRRRLVAVRRRRNKTVAGTLGCLIVSMVMILLVIGPSPVVLVAGALAASLMERWTPGRWDNLTMPLATAGVIHYLLTWLR